MKSVKDTVNKEVHINVLRIKTEKIPEEMTISVLKHMTVFILKHKISFSNHLSFIRKSILRCIEDDHFKITRELHKDARKTNLGE